MDILIFKWRDELIQVNPDEIVYFQADGNYASMMLVSGKERLLSMNLAKVQLVLEEQLGHQSALFERVGRDLIIRNTYLFSIQTLRQKLILLIPKSEKIFELHVSKEALKKLKENQVLKPTGITNETQLRDLQTRKIYPIKIGLNRFGRKSKNSESEYPIDNGDSLISRNHFAIDVLFDMETRCYECYLIDSESANGTFLDNKQIPKDTPTLLHFGCKIKAGKTEFILEQTDTDRTEIA
jgi:hypothetical protein